jgi:hypothetical protein
MLIDTVTYRGVCVTYRQVLDWIHWHLICSTQNCRQLQRYRYFHASQVTVTPASVLGVHQSCPGNRFITISLSFQIIHEVFFAQPNSFLAIILPTPELRAILCCNCQPRNSILILAAWDPRHIVSGQPPQKALLPLLLCVDSLLQRCVYTTPLHSNVHGADHRKHRSSVVARIHFHGNVFTNPLPSSELFWLLGVRSQYIIFLLNATWNLTVAVVKITS